MGRPFPRETGREVTLPDELFDRLVAGSVVRSVRAGTAVYAEGDPAHHAFVVHSGWVRLFRSNRGGRAIELGRAGPRECFGEALLSGIRDRSAEALTEVSLGIVPTERLLALLASSGELALHLARALALREYQLAQQVRYLGLLDVTERVIEVLEAAATSRAGEQLFVPRMSQREIAARAFASLAVVNGVLRRLASGGRLTIEADRIVLHSRKASAR